MKTIRNWGNYPSIECDYQGITSPEQIHPHLEGPAFAVRGNGRSYGDASLNDKILSPLPADHFLEFDEASGHLRCQSGCLLDKILAFSVPKGWFLAVTPGTRLVTVGGAIAADVHGKNHHKDGSFGSHILSITLMTEDGSILECGPDENSDLFALTCGGMGMTGIILEATLQLIPIETAYIKETVIPCGNLDKTMDAFAKHEHVTYSVAWIDCLASGNQLGRSLLMLGEHAQRHELSGKAARNPLRPHSKPKLAVPAPFPQWALNTWTIKAFNSLYYNRIQETKQSLAHYSPFFHPLDSILAWNKMYGKRGFTQYQFVLPLEHSREGMKEILQNISQSGQGSFLAVLKLLGEQRTGVLSFPMKGYTLALDFPMQKSTPALLQELDLLVEKYGGRIYLAKDALMSQALFDKGYPVKKDFIKRIQQINPRFTFQTLQTKRLGLTP